MVENIHWLGHDSFRVEGVRAKPVDRLCRERHGLAPPERGGGAADRGGRGGKEHGGREVYAESCRIHRHRATVREAAG